MAVAIASPVHIFAAPSQETSPVDLTGAVASLGVLLEVVGVSRV
jgi:hypothetical protein